MLRIVVLFVALLLGSAVHAQEGSIEIPRSLYEQVIAKLELLTAIESAVPLVSFEPLTIVEDKDGRIFVTETLKGKIELVHLRYEFTVPLDTRVMKKEKREGIFRIRYNFGGYVDFASPSGKNRFGGLLMLEPLHLGLFGAGIFLGSTGSGACLQLHLTNNVSAFGGVAVRYSGGSLAPVLGLSAAF